MNFFNIICGWSIGSRANFFKLNLSVNFFVFNLNSWLNMLIRKSKSALLKVFLLSKCRHCFPIILMRSRDMRVFWSVKHCSLCIAETPTLLWIIKLFDSLVFYVIKSNRSSSRLYSTESLLFSDAYWRNTIPHRVWRLIVFSYKPLCCS